MSKTVLDIRAIGRRLKIDALQELTCQELAVLLFQLNRTRYALKDQEAFVNFYLAVIEAIQNCRATEKPIGGGLQSIGFES